MIIYFQMCHPTDRGHIVIHKQCTQPCRRIPPKCPRNHRCPKLCNEKCGACVQTVEPTMLPCGHVAKTPSCDSVRDGEALEALSKKCSEKVSFTFPSCNHLCDTTCGNAHSKNPVCPSACGHEMECGHFCQRR